MSVIEGYQSGSVLNDCTDTDSTEPISDIWVNIVGYHYKPWSGEQSLRVKFPWGPQWGDGGYAWVNVVEADIDGICGLRQEIITVSVA
jgi:C1A family cysteine protease